MSIYLLCLLIVTSYFILWMLPALYWKDNSIIDVVWGTGIIVIAWILDYHFTTSMSRLLAILVTASQSRLSMHILLRKRNKKEDWRYAKWRQEWGKTFYWRSFLQIFVLQGILNWMVALPLMDFSAKFSFSWFQIVGLIIWGIGFLLESVADYQMIQFKKDIRNKSKLMRSGLWAYSRHPNYLGQILHWWGIFLIVCTGLAWPISLISPIVITILITSVSGVPMLEQKYKNHPDYEAWINDTPALIPRLK